MEVFVELFKTVQGKTNFCEKRYRVLAIAVALVAIGRVCARLLTV